MESDDPRLLGRVEVTRNGIANLRFEIIEGIRFSEDGKSERPGMVATFRGFLDGKDDFAFGHVFVLG